METTVQNVWAKSKVLIKTGIVALILLLLQIPTYYVEQLITEREGRQKDAIAEVSSKWAGRQTITGPVLVIPYLILTTSNAKGVNDSTAQHEKHLAYFLPDELAVNATATPVEKYRGIYKVALYSSLIKMNGRFGDVHPEKLGLTSENFLWNEAYLKMSVSDSKGLNDEVKLRLNDSMYSLTPDETGNANNELVTRVPLSKDNAGNLSFSSSFSVNGSEQLLFTPVGKSTNVSLSSTWPDPSFTGSSLPQTTTVRDSGFTATWKTSGYKQAFVQQWKDDANQSNKPAAATSLTTTAFGADLFVPVNSYQKIMRSVKYSLLCLVLTFAAFFLIETSNKKSAHPFHYGLVGLALVLFYTLLLSFSEYIGFNPSYVVASVATIGLIGWFVKDVLTSGRLALLLSFVLLLLYGYVFIVLQLQDYSLLLGSIGLFVTLAVIMRFSKKFQW